jgi:hypothetical protein
MTKERTKELAELVEEKYRTKAAVRYLGGYEYSPLRIPLTMEVKVYDVRLEDGRDATLTEDHELTSIWFPGFSDAKTASVVHVYNELLRILGSEAICSKLSRYDALRDDILKFADQVSVPEQYRKEVPKLFS